MLTLHGIHKTELIQICIDKYLQYFMPRKFRLTIINIIFLK